ncbi:MAG: hypothetical protein PWP53_1880 [Lacrimispora sp.]|nr:hypothetical protein [Lacrimispora sp.]
MKQMNIILRELEIKDLDDYLYWNHPSREFHKFNGPYYGKKSEDELKRYVEDLKERLLKGEKNALKNKKIIADKDTDKIIGSVTWSGNLRMMRLAEKLGLKKEAVYRKARIVDHTYYDSVSYGILRDEWF